MADDGREENLDRKRGTNTYELNSPSQRRDATVGGIIANLV